MSLMPRSNSSKGVEGFGASPAPEGIEPSVGSLGSMASHPSAASMVLRRQRSNSAGEHPFRHIACMATHSHV